MTREQRPLDFPKLLEDSRRVQGALGVMVYALATGLAESGAPVEEIEGVIALTKKHFPHLTDHNCDMLARVVYARMTEDKNAKGGRWY